MRHLIVAIVAAAALAGCGVEDPAGQSKTGGKKTAKQTGIGKPAKDGQFTFVVNKVTYKSSVGNRFSKETAQGRFALVHIKVTNHGKEARTLAASDQKLQAAGKTYSASNEATIAMESKAFLEDINPGNSLAAVVPFDIPRNVKPTTIVLHDSPFSGGVKVPLR